MPAELLKIHALPTVTVVEFTLPDDLDSSEFDRLNERVAELFAADAAPARWILDLAPTRYMGSAMLGLMVNIRHRIKSVNGKLALCGMSPALHGIFKACCLERLFTIHRTRDDAVRAMR